MAVAPENHAALGPIQTYDPSPPMLNYKAAPGQSVSDRNREWRYFHSRLASPLRVRVSKTNLAEIQNLPLRM